MINKPRNWDNVQAFADRPKLPVGAYVCKINQAAVRDSDYGPQLCLVFDIAEGEYSGFYAADFKSSQQQDKKWKGVLRQFLPKDDGSDKDEWTKSSLKGLLTAIENSNYGFIWNWDERSLAGKEIGIIFRNEEWEYNGKTGWTARPYRGCSVDTVRDGTYTLPKDKPLKSSSGLGNWVAPVLPSVSDYAEIEDDDSQLPF